MSIMKKRHEMVGMHTGKTYKLGQRVRICVLDTDRFLRTIDFKFAREGEKQDG